MSSEQERQTILIPMNLGSPSQYDRSMFPLMKMKNMSGLDQVDIVLEATLDELFKIRNMAGNLTELKTIFVNAKEEYDRLDSAKKELGNLKPSFHPVKMFARYRSLRLLAAAAEDLYKQTRSSSEELRRRLLSVNGQDVQPVDYDDIPSDARISGIAVPLESPLDEPTATFFTEATDFIASRVSLLPDGNPFGDDQRVEDSADTEYHTPFGTPDSGAASSSSSRLSGASSGQGSGNNFFIFNNSYVASRSAIQSPTLNSGGSHNQGSSPRN